MSFISENGYLNRKYVNPKTGKAEGIDLMAGRTLGVDEHSITVPLVICNPDAYNFREKNFHENKDPKWRMQVNGWDRSKWEWFFNMLETDPNGTPIVFEEKYAADAIHPTLGTDWQYPTWVLDRCVDNGWITKPHFIQQIQKRGIEEEKFGLGQAVVEVTATTTEPEVDVVKKKAAAAKLITMQEALDPKKELSSTKKKSKQSVA
jgi:hypothetical protein